MTKTPLLTAAATLALLAGGAAFAQTPAPAAAPAPATPAPATAPPAAAPPAVVPPAAAAPATPAAPAAGAVVAQGDIVDTLKASGKFTVLLRTLDETNLTGLIKSNKNLTLFAPTDAAFAALPAGELQRLEANPQELQKILTYHLINASVDSTKVKGTKGSIATVAGPQILLDGSGASLTAGNATVTQPDVKTTNGIVHVVDKVLMPTGTPTAANMTTDMPPNSLQEGRIIRASWQPPEDKAEVPPTAPPADPADPNATPPVLDPATPADPAMPADPTLAPATPATPADPAASVAIAAAEPAKVTNGPVLDTAENRAKYPPLSRAGKRTAPKGN